MSLRTVAQSGAAAWVLLELTVACSLRDLSDLDRGGTAGASGAGQGGTTGCALEATSLDCIPLQQGVPFRLHPKHAPNKCVQVPPGSFAAGTTLLEYDCDSSITQKFWLTGVRDDLFTIRSAWTGLCIHAAADNTKAGAGIVQDACLDQVSRQWSIAVREGGLSLVRPDSGLVLDVAGSSDTSNGVGLQQNAYDGSPDMVWNFEPTSGGTIALQPYEQPGTYLSIAGRVVQVVAAEQSRWRLVPGLADASCVSFELSSTPGTYLRHSNFLLWSDANNGTSGFAGDATFCVRDGLVATGVNLRSFESQNFTSHYMTLPGDSQAALESVVDSDDFRVKATWEVQGN